MSAGTAVAAWGFPNPAAPPGSTAYYGVRFAPRRLRDELAALLAWQHQIHVVLDEVSDPGVAAAKLDWWRQEIDGLFGGDARHPLSQHLAPIVRRHDLPKAPFLDVIRAALGVLSRDFPKDREGWIAGARADLGSVAELMARCFGSSDADSLETARRIGAYCALVERLRDAGWLLRRGRLGILPSDLLGSAGLMPETLSRPHARAALPGLLADAAVQVTSLGDALADEASAQPATLRIYWRLRQQLLAELRAADFAVLDQRISVTPIRKLWRAWRESCSA